MDEECESKNSFTICIVDVVFKESACTFDHGNKHQCEKVPVNCDHIFLINPHPSEEYEICNKGDH